MKQAQRSVLVIGAGASGMLAAIEAARAGADVTLVEQNDQVGKKLLASGNGRCNLTNLSLDPSAYWLDRKQDRLAAEAVLSSFSVRDTLAFFRELGLSLVDKEGWVYPRSMQAGSVVRLLTRELDHLGVRIKTRESILTCRQKNGGWEAVSQGWTYRADALVLSVGCPASQVRGSSDFASVFASELGLAWVPFRPALVPLVIREDFGRLWAGVRTQARLTLLADRKESASSSGELQLTERGISGIPVFHLSGHAGRALEEGREVICRINFFPDLSEHELAEELARQKGRRSEAGWADLWSGLLPDKLALFFDRKAKEHDLSPDLHGNGIPKLARLACSLPLTVTGCQSLKAAQVCRGGFPFSEVTDRLESKRCPGLYMTGDTLNIAGPCGGYNLQWAWSSGAIAGRAAAGKG